MPGGYDSLRSSTSTPLCLADNVPLMFPMRGIKNCIKIDEETLSVIRVVDENTFWNELVIDNYASRELELHHRFSTFTPKMVDLPLLLVSSIGDLERPDLLSSFVPARPSPHPSLQQRTEYTSKQAPEQTIIVHNVICGIRARIPPIMNILWEYNGRIACHFMTGSEYMTGEELAILTRRFEEW
ncbi:uncharacterized protein FOMMEDRAFT_145636, partial [Fomitiporia mediterranea MF3/22]|uniref:uncharacterized protein n=1 Tax=Fomitiporia mediterranea (strain MF3/22) TaxID=694068 RepID=UPI00044079B7